MNKNIEKLSLYYSNVVGKSLFGSDILNKHSELIKHLYVAYRIAVLHYRRTNRRLYTVENNIVYSPVYIHSYAKYVVGDRRKFAEPYIMKNSQYVHYYTINVIEGRWPEAEPYIMKNRRCADSCIKQFIEIE